MEILVKGKDADHNAKQLEKCLDVIKSAGVPAKSVLCSVDVLTPM